MWLILIVLVSCGQPNEKKHENQEVIQFPEDTVMTVESRTEEDSTLPEDVEEVDPIIEEVQHVETNSRAEAEVEENTDTRHPESKKETSPVSEFADTQNHDAPISNDQVAPPTVEADHSIWDGLLGRYVSSEGDVNYSAWSKDPEPLNAYLDNLESAPPTSKDAPNAVKSYWINAYNAYTVKLILDNWPVRSIMDLDGGKVWDRKWINLDGQSLSLNDIEHNILRKSYNDARIHFAVNCAAASCPPLANKAYTANNIEDLLEANTRGFINNGKYNSLSPTAIKLSRIFDWYRKDFGNLVQYVDRYSNLDIKATAGVEFLDYDWALNGR